MSRFRDRLLSLPGARSGATLAARRALLSAAIAAKWKLDRARLPLTAEHRELYDIIHRANWRRLQDLPNLVRCRGFNDKIQWLKLFDQSEAIVECSDKLGLRGYVRRKLGDGFVPELYQVASDFDSLDFDALPESFVLKTSHDSGNVVIVRDKERFQIESVRERFSWSLGRIHAWTEGEWAYAFVRPQLFAEELLPGPLSFPPPDYKFYVIEGKVRFMHYIYDRASDPKEQTVDSEGRDLGIALYPHFRYGNAFVRPGNWDELLRTAEALSGSFKCVRVDLYNTERGVFVGELTFWPMGGFYEGEGQMRLGKYLDFDRDTFMPPIYQRIPSTKAGVGATVGSRRPGTKRQRREARGER
jgi:hypothetical protein